MLQRPKQILRESLTYLSRDHSMSLLLLFLVLTVFIIIPLTINQIFWIRLMAIFISLNFIAGILTITSSVVKRIIGVLLTAAVIIVSLSDDGSSSAMRIAEYALWIGYFLILGVMLVRRVFANDEGNIFRIQGAIAAYIIFGMMFSFAYMLIYYLDPSSFLISDRIDMTEFSPGYNFVYFSFVTLCTLGYGDITPLSHIAQSASILEAMIGILFPAILIARLVGLADSRNNLLKS